MKKITYFGLLLILTYFINVSITNATVGGPTYISNIQTNNGQDIAYQVSNMGGRGCPPEVYSYNVINGKSNLILSCNDLEKLNSVDAMTELEITLSKYPIILNKIDLNKNKISAVAKVIREEKYDESKGLWGKTDFSVDIFQNNVKKTTLEYSGCRPEQNHTIEGYANPESNYIILKVSTIGDCFEGGYTSQSIYSLSNINFYDEAAIPIESINAEPTNNKSNLSFIAQNQKVINDSKNNEVVDNAQNNIRYDNNSEIIDKSTNKSEKPISSLSYQIFIGVLVIIILTLILKRK